MKNLKEIIIILIQLFMFYIYPIFAGPIDAMGMVFIILLTTLILSVLISIINKRKMKYFYPIFISITFIPSIFIYYNESALIHSLWYLVIGIIGIIIGNIINLILGKK